METKHQYIHFAKQLRNTQTPWEAKLWQRLRGHRFFSLKFKRQVPIGPYIVDFCCNEKRLVIELDGSQHGTESGVSADELKQKYLCNSGYTVLHFWNNDIDQNMDGVLEVVRRSAFQPLS